MNQTFSWDPFGYVLVDNSYFYLLIGIFLPISFLVFPARRKDDNHVPFYDWILFAVTLVAAYTCPITVRIWSSKVGTSSHRRRRLSWRR